MSLLADNVLLDGGLDRLGPLREPQRPDGLVQVEHVGGAAHLQTPQQLWMMKHIIPSSS